MRLALSQICKSCSTVLRSRRAGATTLPRWSPSRSAGRVRSIHLSATRSSSWRSSNAPSIESSKRLASSAAQPESTASQPERKRVLRDDDLFHSFTNSPIPEIRLRGAYMRQHAYCPHPDHRPTRMAGSGTGKEASQTGNLPPAHVDFECPDCGIPVYCSKEHWMDQYDAHLEICDTLRQANEDDHDLRSGRFFPEFDYPGPQMEEAMVNMLNWDTFLYTREFGAINSDRSMRQVTRMLTYPLTVASVLHELSPYNIRQGGRMTVEGLKSFSGTIFGPFDPQD